MADTGVASAIVVDTRDPKGLGRVRVRYPWHEQPDAAYWARLVAPLGVPVVGAAPAASPLRTSGALSVEASEITVNGTGPVRVRSSASLTLLGSVVHIN